MAYKLPKASNEQNQVIVLVKSKKNVVVDSVAGSGKTTTILHVATELKHLQILLLTYNSKLKLETKQKRESLNINNLDVHNYHSFGYKYYSKACQRDPGIIDVVKNNIIPNTSFCYNLIILDELQDMTPLYYQFVSKIIYDNKCAKKQNIQVCGLGDKFQAIYDFNKADSRFIIYTDKLFPQINNDWIFSKLSYNFRTTIQIADFINKCVLKDTRIKATKDGNKVRYVICNTFKPYTIFSELNRYLRDFLPEEIFVLAPSVRSAKSPIRILANMASKNNIDIYVPNNDDEKIDEDIIKNKIVFSTFHQVKGLERKAVMIFGFDDSYFKFYKKNVDTNKCPNEIYVAITRAIDSLCIFHHHKNDFLQFLNTRELNYNTVFEQRDKLSVKDDSAHLSSTIQVIELTKYLPSEIIDSCMSLLKFKKLKNGSDKINIPIKVEQEDGKFEIVSEITNVAIPAYYEYLNTRKMTIFNKLLQTNHMTLNEIDFSDPRNLLKLANTYCSMITGYNYKLRQITNYNWLSKKNLNSCLHLLRKYISDKAIYEEPVMCIYKKFDKIISGTINCVDDQNNYVFKCTTKLSSDHFIQLAILAYCNETVSDKRNTKKIINTYKNVLKQFRQAKNINKKYEHLISLEKLDVELDYERKYKLMNIITGEIYELDMVLSNVKLMLYKLLYAKFGCNKQNADDNKFITNMLHSVEKYHKL
jgi:hypothetical protein